MLLTALPGCSGSILFIGLGWKECEEKEKETNYSQRKGNGAISWLKSCIYHLLLCVAYILFCM